MYAVELVRHVAATTVSLLWSNICIAVLVCCALFKLCECFIHAAAMVLLCLFYV
jgi:hypothetical protein